MKNEFILALEESFWELTDLIYYASLIGKTNDKYLNTTAHRSSADTDEICLYDNVSNKLNEAEDALYELIGKRQSEFNILLKETMLSCDKETFEYLFGINYEIKNEIKDIDVFIDEFKICISMIDYLHKTKNSNRREKFQEIMREITNESLIWVAMDEFDKMYS